MEPKTLKIDDVEYVRKDSVTSGRGAEKVDGLECVLVRTYSAGVHFGYLKKHSGTEVTLINSRRVYYWEGAMTLSQLSVDGSSKIKSCKITVPVNFIILTQAIEILPMTDRAQKNLYGADEWKM